MKLVIFTGAEAVLHPTVGEIRPGLNEIFDHDVAAQLLSAGKTSGEFLAGQELPVAEKSSEQASTTEAAPEADITDTTAESDAAPAPRARKRAQE